MANTSTSTYKGNFIEVSFTGTGADWDFTTDTNVPAELRSLGRLVVSGINFVRYGAGDKCVILETSTGPVMYSSADVSTDRADYGDDGVIMRPFVDISAGSFADISKVKIIFELA